EVGQSDDGAQVPGRQVPVDAVVVGEGAEHVAVVVLVEHAHIDQLVDHALPCVGGILRVVAAGGPLHEADVDGRGPARGEPGGVGTGQCPHRVLHLLPLPPLGGAV